MLISVSVKQALAKPMANRSVRTGGGLKTLLEIDSCQGQLAEDSDGSLKCRRQLFRAHAPRFLNLSVQSPRFTARMAAFAICLLCEHSRHSGYFSITGQRLINLTRGQEVGLSRGLVSSRAL